MIDCDAGDFTHKVHDNVIKSFFVDLEKGTLKMETTWEDKEVTTIEFTGLLAHKFEHVISTSIIFGLYQATIESFIDEEKDYLSESLKYGFPSTKASTLEKLKHELEAGQYKIFWIDSVLGLCGYIIAKDINIVIQQMNVL